MTWYHMDLHVHTPASHDSRAPDASYLQILEQAEQRGLDIIGIADHNTVAGIARIRTRIQELELLRRLNRLRSEEKHELEEFGRLGRKMLILPGFEFTATLGFHVLGMFPPETLVRELEYILLDLRVPADRLDVGSTEVGATVDVITAYKTIAEAGGLVIAAHANSTHGVAMRGFNFGGQTKIAYTQDPNLHALEVTDLEQSGRRTTASFYDGSKPEYPRRMHCIQGSDAHCLDSHTGAPHDLGVGERATEILLPELSFEAIKAVFLSNDFTRTRPYRGAAESFDFVQQAQEAGRSIVQSFHERMARKGGYLRAITRDVVAFANTNGGTLWIGVGAKKNSPPSGIDRPDEAKKMLLGEIDRAVVPPIDVDIDALKSQGKNVLRVTVPRGDAQPYAVNGLEIYVRQESDTSRAVRDEIVQLVQRTPPETALAPAEPSAEGEAPVVERTPAAGEGLSEPRTGVEVVEVDERKGTKYYTLKDVRNGNVVSNVTRQSARRLWRYAITEYEDHPVNLDEVQWLEGKGLWKTYKRARRQRYDLVQRESDGRVHYYYGVTEDGIHGQWSELVATKK
jgi:PHP family Zn ribbon phosphoesterase